MGFPSPSRFPPKEPEKPPSSPPFSGGFFIRGPKSGPDRQFPRLTWAGPPRSGRFDLPSSGNIICRDVENFRSGRLERAWPNRQKERCPAAFPRRICYCPRFNTCGDHNSCGPEAAAFQPSSRLCNWQYSFPFPRIRLGA